MSAADITAALGRACRSGGWWRCCCPAHASWGAALAIIVRCHAGCSRGNILAELRRRGLHNSGTLWISGPTQRRQSVRVAVVLVGAPHLGRTVSALARHNHRGAASDPARAAATAATQSTPPASAAPHVAIVEDVEQPVAVHSTYLAFLPASRQDQDRHLQSSHRDVNGSAHRQLLPGVRISDAPQPRGLRCCSEHASR
jgi:hypothetical protein